jgi:long-chain acyl-CoA synthetase
MILSTQAQDDPRTLADLTQSELDGIMLSEVTRVNEARPDREAWEAITALTALREPFSVEGGTLTQTMKLRREAVRERYATELDALLKRLR